MISTITPSEHQLSTAENALRIRSLLNERYIDGLSAFYVRGDGRIYKHRVDRVGRQRHGSSRNQQTLLPCLFKVMIDEDKELVKTPLNRREIMAPVTMSSAAVFPSLP